MSASAPCCGIAASNVDAVKPHISAAFASADAGRPSGNGGLHKIGHTLLICRILHIEKFAGHRIANIEIVGRSLDTMPSMAFLYAVGSFSRQASRQTCVFEFRLDLCRTTARHPASSNATTGTIATDTIACSNWRL